MKKAFFISAMLCFFINTASPTSSIVTDTDRRVLQIDLICQTIDETVINKGLHRTPPQISKVYYDSSSSTVYFDSPCYECTLELVVPGTDTAAFSYIIPDGDDVVQLPSNLSGEYELHIHRGNYCFYATIEL